MWKIERNSSSHLLFQVLSSQGHQHALATRRYSAVLSALLLSQCDSSPPDVRITSSFLCHTVATLFLFFVTLSSNKWRRSITLGWCQICLTLPSVDLSHLFSQFSVCVFLCICVQIIQQFLEQLLFVHYIDITKMNHSIFGVFLHQGLDQSEKTVNCRQLLLWLIVTVVLSKFKCCVAARTVCVSVCWGCAACPFWLKCLIIKWTLLHLSELLGRCLIINTHVSVYKCYLETEKSA